MRNVDVEVSLTGWFCASRSREGNSSLELTRTWQPKNVFDPGLDHLLQTHHRGRWYYIHHMVRIPTCQSFSGPSAASALAREPLLDG